MGTASGDAAKQGKQKRKRWTGLQRACGLGWLLVVSIATEQGLQGLFTGQPPAVLTWLGPLLNLQGNQPLWQKALGVGVVVVVGAALLVATYLAWFASQSDDPPSGSVAVAGDMSGGAVAQGNRPVVVQAQQVTFIESQQVQSQPLAAPAKEMPAHVSAPSGLPRAVAFIGRDKTLADLKDHLRQGSAVGVFALAGMGGVGKTALAAEAVFALAQEAQTFPAGAAWVGCEDLHGPEGLAEVWNRVARALDFDVAALPDPETRRGALHALLARSPRRLLAVDNVDGLEAGPLLSTLAVQGHTTLLLTARLTLDLPGLKPISLDILPAEDARTLFAETLRRSSPQQPRPTLEDEAVQPDLVVDLGRLPLALELTATYAGRQGLTLSTVREEIARDGVEAAPFMPAYNPQQRALMLRFDRSWEALAEKPRRQRHFASLALLKGDSFPRAAALAMAKAAGGKQATEASAASDLAALVDFALVEALPGERYRLHPLLRNYASKRLEANTKAVRDRLGEAMMAFWVAYAEAHPGHRGMDALAAEAAGLIGALTWAHEQAWHQELLALTRALRGFLFLRGRIDEARRVYPWAVDAAQALKDTREERWAAYELALLDARQGRLLAARTGYERALELARQLKDPKVERFQLHALGLMDSLLGRLVEARAGHARALELAQQLGDLLDEWMEVMALAALDDRLGNWAAARKGYERALQFVQQLGNQPAERRAVYEDGLHGRTGRIGAAQEGYERALELTSPITQLTGQSNEEVERVVQDEQRRVLEIAHMAFEQAVEIARKAGDPETERVEVHCLAVLNCRLERWPAAQEGFERALELARQLGDPAAEADELGDLGILIGLRGEPDLGRKLVLDALTFSEQLSDVFRSGIAHRLLAWIDERQGNREEAIAHYHKAKNYFEQAQSEDAEKMRGWLRRLGEQL